MLGAPDQYGLSPLEERTNMTDAPDNQAPSSQLSMPQIRVMGQYVKDLSFENPGAPASLRTQGNPEINVGIDVKAAAGENDTYEVVLDLNAQAKSGDQPIFLAELSYAGLFQLSNMDKTALEPFLLIECPRILFPFARRVMADATRDGGFPPLMLEPIDFAQLYRSKMAESQQAGAQPSPTDPAAGNA